MGELCPSAKLSALPLQEKRKEEYYRRLVVWGAAAIYRDILCPILSARQTSDSEL